MSSKHTCPICRQPASWTDNPYRPFCTKQCRDKDLLGWFDGNYVIPGRSLFDHTDEDLPTAQTAKPPAPLRPLVVQEAEPEPELPTLRLLRTERSDPTR